MGFIAFIVDELKMDETGDLPANVLEERNALLLAIIEKLNAKYVEEKSCTTHPLFIQYLRVSLIDDALSIRISNFEVCHCHNMMDRINMICKNECFIFNTVNGGGLIK